MKYAVMHPLHRLSFKDQYIEVSTAVPADADLYGLGEVTLNEGFLLPRGGKIITMWNRDIGSDNVNVNLYGSHPFYMQVNDGTMMARPTCIIVPLLPAAFFIEITMWSSCKAMTVRKQ